MTRRTCFQIVWNFKSLNNTIENNYQPLSNVNKFDPQVSRFNEPINLNYNDCKK